MFSVAQEDVLKALKRFRRLAKQDLLASAKTPDPAFWRRQAEIRRAQYQELMDQIAEEGVVAAYRRAVSQYAELPLLSESERDPLVGGKEQALEMFFSVLGLSEMARTRLRNARRRVRGSHAPAHVHPARRPSASS